MKVVLSVISNGCCCYSYYLPFDTFRTHNASFQIKREKKKKTRKFYMVSMMNVRLLLMLLAAAVLVDTTNANFPDCKSGPLSTFPICDQSLPARVRAADLVSRMTTAEKISRLIRNATAIPRLGLPNFIWGSEALHGIGYSAGVTFGGDLPAATSFPMPINLGASFDLPLVHRIASIISTEARAFNNENQASLTYYTPNINMFRDPRWGRGQETPGEDPFLTSQYVYTLINGLQNGDDERYLKIGATCKHFDAYDLENWNGTDRHHFNAIVTDQDLVETYLPPFETCIRDAHVTGIMCSYNMINGIPACANRFFLQNIARDSYKLDGFIVSDGGAIPCIMNTQNYTSTVQETVAVALHAGTDLESGGTFYLQHAQEALDNKTIVESDIDQAVERTFSVLVRLGWFDPPEQQPYRRLNKDNVNTMEAQQLALKSAQESIVLLKNLNNALPLNIDQLKGKKIALIGPTANATLLMQGNYFGKAPFLIDPISAFKSIVENTSIDVEYRIGCQISGIDESGFASAIELARLADVVFFFGGLNQSIEAEGRDRTTIDLPPIQFTLLQELEKVVHSPLHVVIMSGSGLDLSYIRDSFNFGSLIWAGYPGQAGGSAIASVIFGQYNPAGRLPITFYPASYVDAVSMFDMQMRPSPTNPGRTYKFYTGQAVYEFGFGLSYTTFVYSWSNDSSISSYSIDTLLKPNYSERRVLVHSFRVNVTNTGSMVGDDVVLAFITPPRSSLKDPSPPIKQLFGFERVHLNVNETIEVFFPLYADTLLTVATDGSKWLQPGLYQIVIGQKSMHTIELQDKSALWSSLDQ